MEDLKALSLSICLQGVQVDGKESDCIVEETKSVPGCKQESESEEMCVLLRQQKCLHNMTERALRKNQPLIISNLMNENASLSMTEELTDTQKLEQMCLQALSMRMFSGGPSIEITIDYYHQEEDQETCTSNNKGCTTPAATPSAISDSDLPEIVSPFLVPLIYVLKKILPYGSKRMQLIWCKSYIILKKTFVVATFELVIHGE